MNEDSENYNKLVNPTKDQNTTLDPEKA